MIKFNFKIILLILIIPLLIIAVYYAFIYGYVALQSYKWIKRQQSLVGQFEYYIERDGEETKIYEQPDGKNPEILLNVKNLYSNPFKLIETKKLILGSDNDYLFVYDLSAGLKKNLYSLDRYAYINFLATYDEALSVIGISYVDMQQILLLDLKNLSVKKLAETNEQGLRIFESKFFSKDSAKLYFVDLYPEGTSDYKEISLITGEIKAINMPNGYLNPQNIKLADADGLPGYGGCLIQDSYNLGWYDIENNFKYHKIFKEDNVNIKILSWDAKGNKFLYSKQKYDPVGCDVKASDLEEERFFIYDTVIKITKKVNSEKEVIKEWYPNQSDEERKGYLGKIFYEDKGVRFRLIP